MTFSTPVMGDEQHRYRAFWKAKLQEWFKFEDKCKKELMTEFFGGRKTRPVKEYARCDVQL